MRTLIALLLLLTFSATAQYPGQVRKPDFSTEDAVQPRVLSAARTPAVYVLSEDFDGTFPPAGWTVLNPDAGRTWERTSAASGYGIGTASARMRFYAYTPDAGQIDSLVSPPVTGLTGDDSLSFDYAYVSLPSTLVGPDTVEVYLSTDGGVTFPQHVVTLSVADSTGLGTAFSFVPDSSEWATRRFLLPSSVAGATAQFLFLSRNHFGQNFYLDNIRAGRQAVADAAVLFQVSPEQDGYVIETFPFVPSAEFGNLGTAPVPAPFSVAYEIRDTGNVLVYSSTRTVDTLSPGSAIQVAFDAVAAGLPAGHYDTRIIALLPGDEVTANDTLAGEFTADLYIRTLPYAQGFEGSTDEGWSGREVTGTRNEWVRGVPAKPVQLTAAYDGTTAWMTSFDSVYQNNQNAALTSPYFDLSTATNRTVLEFHHNFLIEAGYDGAIVECSTDGGTDWLRADNILGEGADYNTDWSRRWYNTSVTFGRPNSPKWSGSSTTYPGAASGWIRSTTPLGPLAGEPLVRFRWRFRTDESEGTEGWAMDAVRIFEDSLKLVRVPTQPGWSLLSNPVITPSDSVVELFPGSLYPYGFTYVGDLGYVQSGTMTQGSGYWLRMLAAGIEEIEGEAIYDDTLALTGGWQVIGSISLPVPFDSILQDPPGHVLSDYFVFTPGSGYVTDGYLWPGQAAWVKSSGGQIVLRGVWKRRETALVRPPERKGTEGSVLKLMAADGSERVLRLDVGAELPPSPPDGVFDARIAARNPGLERQVLYSSAMPPLRAVWNPADARPGEVLELRFPGGRLVRLSAGEEILIGAETGGSFTITSASHEVFPLTYSLAQNYPNPFNPETRIRIDVPQVSRVRLALFDILGREVQVLADGILEAGVHTAVLDGSGLAGGVYFYRLVATPQGGGNQYVRARSMMLLK